MFGYTVRYQAPWVASSATPEQACAVFNPAPVSQAELLAASHNGVPVDAAIQITPYARASTYDDAVIDIHNRKSIDAGDTIDLGVGNTFGERIMAVVTNPDGSHSHMFAYLFSVRGKPFLAAAYEQLSANFDETVRTLDRMMRTLRVG